MKLYDDIKTYIKNNYITVLFCVALLICSVSTGGLQWYSCIIPLFVVGGSLIITYKEIQNRAIIYSVVLLFLAIVALLNGKGDFQTGIYETEKLILFIATLLLGTVIRKKDDIILGICISSVVCASFGLLTYCGLFTSGEYVLKSFEQIRLQSFFKYANTTACFLSMGYFSCMEIYKKTKRLWHVYAGAAILVAMFLTASKAVIPLFFAVSLYYIYRNKDLATMFVNQNIWICLFVLPIILLAEKHLNFFVFIIILICILFATHVKLVKKDTIAIKLWSAFSIVGFIGGSVLLLVKPSLLTTFAQRLTYMKDSLPLLAEGIWFGNGPGSWRVLTYAVQSSGYNVLYMHNSFLQLMFENGLLFLVAFLFVGVKSIIFSIKAKQDVFTVILLLLVLHACIDFDLSFGVMLMALGVICGHICFANSARKICQYIAVLSKLLLVVLICFSVIYMMIEYSVRSRFEGVCAIEQYDAALTATYQLEKICPKDSILQLNIALLEEKTGGDVDEIKYRIDKACALSPHDPVPYEAYINYNMTNENIRDLCLTYIYMRPRFEGTHQAVKSFINKAHENNLIDENRKNDLLEEMGEIRYALKVYDRDELLDRIMSQRMQEEKGE